MKQLITVLSMILSFGSALAENHWMSGPANEPYVPNGAWYWDPNKSGMGLNVTFQKSKHGSTGYLAFAAFYTYKDDGSQAWYTINGFYVPNEDVYEWREKRDVFGVSVKDAMTNPTTVEGAGGNYWGGDAPYMGRVDTQLLETNNGMPLGGPHRPNNIWAYKDVSMVWRNPSEIDIYIDGDETPTHTFVRYNYHGDLRKGDADFLTNGFYKLLGLRYGKLGNDVTAEYIQSTMSFSKIDPLTYFGAGANTDLFMNVTEFNENKSYYLSNQAVGRATFKMNDENSPELFKSFETTVRDKQFVVLVYDNDTQTISGFDMNTVAGNPESGLYPKMGDYKFKGYLAPEDQGRLSMYPAACAHCNGTSDATFKPEYTRRSAWHLYKVPDGTGLLHSQLPDMWHVGKNIRP